MSQTLEIRRCFLRVVVVFSQLKAKLQEEWILCRGYCKIAYLDLFSLFSFMTYKVLFYLRGSKKDGNKKWNISMDARILTNNVSGLERYIYQLTVHLSKIETEKCFYIFLHQPAFENKVGQNFKEEIAKDLKKLITSQNKKIAYGEIELFHVTWQDMHWYHNLPLIWSKRSVITIHDLINLLTPEYHHLLERVMYKILLKCVVRWADRIIAISEYTKQDIIKHLNADKKKIKVIHPATDSRFQPILNRKVIEIMKSKYHIQGRYILTVGKSYIHKNIPHLIKAFKNLVSKENIEHKLVLVGEKYLVQANLQIQKIIAELDLEEKVIWLGYIDDEDMPAMFTGADLFVLPSYYEGFGFPVLEAMSCGTPVIASNVTSIPEVVGDAGILVSPTDVEELTRSMSALLKDQELRNTLIKKGLERSKTFSWEKCARETLEVYNELLNS